MSSKTETVQPESQASPLAEDVLSMLQANIAGAGQALDTSQAAGTAIRQFVESGPSRLPEEQRQALETTQRQTREAALDQIGEEFSIMGGTQGSPAGFATAETMRELVPRQTQQTFQEERARAAQRLDAISQMAAIGQQNLAPFLEMASQGILPEQVVKKEHPVVKGVNALTGTAMGVAGLRRAFGGGRDRLAPGQFQNLFGSTPAGRVPRPAGTLNPATTGPRRFGGTGRLG